MLIWENGWKIGERRSNNSERDFSGFSFKHPFEPVGLLARYIVSVPGVPIAFKSTVTYCSDPDLERLADEFMVGTL